MAVNQDKTVDIQGVGQPFKKLQMILNQAGTAIPTIAVMLLNNLVVSTGQNPTLARTSAGLYTITLTGGFQGTLFVKSCNVRGGATAYAASLEKTSVNVLTLRTYDAADAAADLVGDVDIAVELWPA